MDFFSGIQTYSNYLRSMINVDKQLGFDMSKDG